MCNLFYTFNDIVEKKPKNIGGILDFEWFVLKDKDKKDNILTS